MQEEPTIWNEMNAPNTVDAVKKDARSPVLT